MKIKLVIGAIFLQVMLSAYNFFSPMIKFERINVNDSVTIQLAHKNIIINSEKVYTDDLQYSSGNDYQINYGMGKITFFEKLGNVYIEYMIYPASLLDKFSYYQVQEFSNSTQIKIPQLKKRLFYHDTKLNVTGNKTISVSVSSDEDFDLDQSLFLKINGELSEDVYIEAQLNDSQSPITPEGDSRQLSNLDKVFLRVYGKRYEIAFGDLEMKFSDTKFLNYTPKFEGLKIGWKSGNEYTGAMAISKGKKTTIEFNGLEAKQGPYYLSTEELYSIQVVPGSENVHLNGIKMQRGTDYTIDYAEGSITLSNEHFISASSYIQVSFQFSDQNFRQNLYIASTEIHILENLKIKNYLMIQNDDKNNPLSEAYSVEEIEVLKNCGDTIAWIDAIYEVEDGDYIVSENGNYYIYVGNDSTQTGEYNLHFTDMGFGNGDYESSENGDYYEYVGENNGSFLPIKKLIKPVNQTNYDVSLNYNIGFLELNSEGLITFQDNNSFSEKDDDDNISFAANISALIKPNYDLLKPQLKLNYQRLGKNLKPFADIQDPIYNYEVATSPDSLESNEYSLDFRMDIFDFFQPQLIIKNKIITGFSTLNYFALSNRIGQKKFLPQVFHRSLFWKNIYESGLIEKSEFAQHNLNLNYKLLPFEFSFDYFDKEQNMERENTISEQDNLVHYKYDISFSQDSKYSMQLFYKDESLSMNFVNENIEKNTKTIGLKSIYSSIMHRVNANFSHREVTDSTKQKFDMVDVNISNSWLANAVNLNSYYTLQNVEFYPKIKELTYVGNNMGSYDENGDEVGLNEGDYDWKITEIDYANPEMSIQVKANCNLILNPGNVASDFWKRIQTETHLLVTENSTNDDKTKIYLLHPGILMDKDFTIYGRNILQQTLWLDLIKNKLDARIKYKYENTLDNRYNDISEKRDTRVWEARFQLKSIKATNLELLFENRFEENSRYDSQIETNSYELSNRWGKDFSFRTSLQYSKESGNEGGVSQNYHITAYQIDEKVTFFWKRKYRILSGFTYKRNERSGSSFLGFLNDKRDGNIFKWLVNLNYRMNNYTSVNLQYSGNKYPQQSDIHKLSVEVIAEF